MRFIVSRGFVLPQTVAEMHGQTWFAMWQRAMWPYQEPLKGDTLFWYEAPTGRIVWQTTVAEAERFRYSGKQEARERLQLSDKDATQQYFVNGPEQGFCLAWTVDDARRVDIPKPDGLRFPQLGWLRGSDPTAERWLGAVGDTDEPVLDALSVAGPLGERLRQLDAQMEDVSPERVRALVHLTLRRDTELVRALKAAVGYSCQLPGCDAHILTRDGSFYVEVAHVQPVSQGGKSRLGNLVALCPNHHKEFDLGDLRITFQDTSTLEGMLNGRCFRIEMPWALDIERPLKRC